MIWKGPTSVYWPSLEGFYRKTISGPRSDIVVSTVPSMGGGRAIVCSSVSPHPPTSKEIEPRNALADDCDQSATTPTKVCLLGLILVGEPSSRQWNVYPQSKQMYKLYYNIPADK